MKQHQKGNEDESYAPILPLNISISYHVDGRYTRTLSTAITTSKAGR
jgi:hypothetical protein